MLKSVSANKILYVCFILFGLYKLIVFNEFGNCSMYMGIALAFDPFDVNMSWKTRPSWQKAVTLVHLAFVAACLGFEIGMNDTMKQGFIDGWNS